ncbi:bifunctional adenosylcobinamide kinase/adenosylcobinamide-phosphate guanylyltransferase [Siminovitchia sp. FSL W7-1587]|uniref:bifunctional adenosylcobinamide kinase/adenosylcobinamide-phosphate guanylyltransferase n=1 Tax=Siminovitchia sp. FSL W7-1587 TaxID=2954699 RepID=UPI0030D0A8D5
MHFVTGGAFNGKAEWVRSFYKLHKESSFNWFSAYREDALPNDLPESRIVVLEGVEQWILQMGSAFTQDTGRKWIEAWLDWERSGERTIVLIGTDISKGIVPMEREVREWRDLTGWFYQDAVKCCDRFDSIWYGVAKRLK